MVISEGRSAGLSILLGAVGGIVVPAWHVVESLILLRAVGSSET